VFVFGVDGFPALCPYIYYKDSGAALEWLTRVFGFVERMRATDEEGQIRHCEMNVGDSVIMMGSPPGHQTPVNPITVGLYVHVDDVDTHYERAVGAGAAVQGPPEDMEYGVRSYGVLDLDGHQWWFATPLPG
jgi:PhnB protein